MTCPKGTLDRRRRPAFARTFVHDEVYSFFRAMTNYERYFSVPETLPQETIAAYEESALLHGRTLLQFFSHEDGRAGDVRACHYRIGKCPATRSAIEDEWMPAINSRLMHLTSAVYPAPKTPTDWVEHGSKWRLSELWKHLESEFILLAQNAKYPQARVFFGDLISSQIPAWRAAI